MPPWSNPGRKLWEVVWVQLALRGITRLDELADCPADLNGDRVVDAADLTELLARWGEPCVVGD